MIQVIEQTDEEKMSMYMKEPKEKLAQMLIQCNKVLNSVLKVDQVFIKSDVIKSVCPHCGNDELYIGKIMNWCENCDKITRKTV